jgi:prefoldin subunit 5
MFNFLQHLFTARSLQSENAILQDKVKKLEAENKSLLQKIEELTNRIKQLESTPQKHPKIDYPDLGIV